METVKGTLLVDSLEHPISTADSEIHRLLLDCNKIEEQILTKTVAELKKILYGLGIRRNKKTARVSRQRHPFSELGAVCLTQAVFLFSSSYSILSFKKSSRNSANPASIDRTYRSPEKSCSAVFIASITFSVM